MTPTPSADPPKPDLQAIRERAEKATPGPWSAEDRRRAALKNIRVIAGREDVCELSHVHQRDYQGSFRGDHAAADALDIIGLANADFIAHARQDIPDLLAYVERLESSLARVTLERDEAVGLLRRCYRGAVPFVDIAAFLSRHYQPKEQK